MTECPNCVTPWKCNGPHMTDDIPPTPLVMRSQSGKDWPVYTADQMCAYGDARAAAAVLADRPTGGAPCARHCEATAFGIEIRSLRRQLAESEARAAALRDALQEAADRLDGLKGGSVSDTIQMMRDAIRKGE